MALKSLCSPCHLSGPCLMPGSLSGTLSGVGKMLQRLKGLLGKREAWRLDPEHPHVNQGVLVQVYKPETDRGDKWARELAGQPALIEWQVSGSVADSASKDKCVKR